MSTEPPSTEAIGRWYWTTRRVSWPFRRFWLDVEIDGADNVPPSGPVVLAANHLSFLDSLLLMYSLPRPVFFLGKAEYLSGRVTRRLFPAAGMIPVDRTGRGLARSLDQAAQRLAGGDIIGIFPEGTRSRDGLLHRGHPGVAHLALRAGAPVVPVGIVGTDLAQPPGTRLPRRGSRIRLRFGAPIGPGPYGGSRQKQRLTDDVMRSIAALSGQVYRHEFAPLPTHA